MTSVSIRTFIRNCTYSSSIDKSVTLSDIKVNYGVSHYLWNISELTSGSDYMIRIFGIGRYINTSGTSGIFSIDSSLDATDFSVVYENNAERVFKFKVRNTADETLNNVAWKIETGESTINSNSSMDMTLESGEEAFVFVFHNYTTYGDFIVNATVFNAEFSDITPNINVTIPDPTPFPTDGLVHYYKLDATSGDVVDELDSENLTNNGATRGVTGKIENAFSFDGSNDYVNNSQEIDLGNNYSIFAWVKIDTIAGNSKYIVGNGNKAGTNYMSISYWIENDGNIWWQGDLSSQQDMYLYWDADIVANDSWYHVGIVKRDKKRVEAYVNGQNLTNVLFERTDNWGGDTDYDNDGDFSIGAYTSNGAKTGNFDGSIDEVGVWNRSFNLTEISNLYNDGDGLSY